MFWLYLYQKKKKLFWLFASCFVLFKFWIFCASLCNVQSLWLLKLHILELPWHIYILNVILLFADWKVMLVKLNRVRKLWNWSTKWVWIRHQCKGRDLCNRRLLHIMRIVKFLSDHDCLHRKFYLIQPCILCLTRSQ